jgi:phenylalanyl-tRNA synthetase beta chain
MRLSLDWLGEWIALPDPDALVERLSTGGFEDVEIDSGGPDLSGVVVGHVVAHGKHPNADRLSLCKVDAGDAEPVEVVCGAPNVAQGQKIAFAATGTKLPDGTKLKRSKIRGVVSNGMICSSRELALGDDHDGILVLDPDAPIGAPIGDVLSSGGRTLELGITPNRGDAASVLGLAREVQAFFGGEIVIPETQPSQAGAPSSASIRIEIDAADMCHHYVGRVVRGVSVGPSPEWVTQRLEASGLRSINNVVDVTNLVLLELGQPLHAFDLSTLDQDQIRVRKAHTGEKLVTLDGETRELVPEDLVIADASHAIALAGVMGGAATEVGGTTRDLLIESAHFHPTVVRRGARRHGIHSEASYRFERGIDREGVRRAADRAATLIAEIAGGEVAPDAVEARGVAPEVTGEVSLDVSRLNRLLGTSLDTLEVSDLLSRVGVPCHGAGEGVVVGTIPSWRNDLHGPHDLTEEVARIHGYDRIPTTDPVGSLVPVEMPAAWRRVEAARDGLVAAGLYECVTLPFVGPGDLDLIRLPETDPLRETVRVVNPISEEESRLRSTLVPSLLRLVRQNRSRQADHVRLFEICRVFRPRGDGGLPFERHQLVAVTTLDAEHRLWDPENPPPLFFQAKGIAKRVVKELGYLASFRAGAIPPYLHPGAGAAIQIGENVVGSVGELHPDVVAGFEIDVPCALLELDLGALEGLALAPTRFVEVSRQPQVRRDLAVLLDRDQAAGDVLAAIRKTAGSDLVSAELFDRYEGKGVPEGRISVAFRLVFQHPDKTLTDAQVASATDRVVRMLAHRFGGELR